VIALLQRVGFARITIKAECLAEIGPGVLALVAVKRGDDSSNAKRLAKRILAYRLFPDSAGRMNLDLRASAGELLMVPQFTLAADTAKGNRPSFAPSADPAIARVLWEELAAKLKSAYSRVQCGRFGADMRVTLRNDGPVTFWIEG